MRTDSKSEPKVKDTGVPHKIVINIPFSVIHGPAKQQNTQQSKKHRTDSADDVAVRLSMASRNSDEEHGRTPSGQEHGPPPDGLECLVTMEDIDDSNYVEYQCFPSLEWKPALMEQSVLEELLKTQFYSYIARVKKTDCQAELRRLLATGPPIFVSDPHGLPLADGSNDSHIIKLWFASDKTERSAKLDVHSRTSVLLVTFFIITEPFLWGCS